MRGDNEDLKRIEKCKIARQGQLRYTYHCSLIIKRYVQRRKDEGKTGRVK